MRWVVAFVMVRTGKYSYDVYLFHGKYSKCDNRQGEKLPLSAMRVTIIASILQEQEHSRKTKGNTLRTAWALFV